MPSSQVVFVWVDLDKWGTLDGPVVPLGLAPGSESFSGLLVEVADECPGPSRRSHRISPPGQDHMVTCWRGCRCMKIGGRAGMLICLVGEWCEWELELWEGSGRLMERAFVYGGPPIAPPILGWWGFWGHILSASLSGWVQKSVMIWKNGRQYTW